MDGRPLTGARILVLEDEFLIAMDVEQLCRDAGADDIAIARSTAEAEEAITRQRPDIAVLDVMLGGATVLDFASLLRREGVPFLFMSGYEEQDEVFASFPDVRMIGKPYASAELLEALASGIKANRTPS